MVTSARFYIFFRGKSLFNVKHTLLNLSCVFCKEFYFCIMDFSRILFSGHSNSLEPNQLICIARFLCDLRYFIEEP